MICQQKGNFTRETVFLQMATQKKKVIGTKYVEAKIDKTQQKCKCRLYGDRLETINCIIIECGKLAQWDFKT